MPACRWTIIWSPVHIIADAAALDVFAAKSGAMHRSNREFGMLKGIFKDFREFAMRGSVVDLAIGVIIGAAFGRIVESLVNDIIMPIIGAVTGGLDFSNYFLPLVKAVNAPSLAEARKQGAVLAWGNFLTIIVNFIIVAIVLFLVIRAITLLRRNVLHEEEKAAVTPRQEVLLEEIRDLLARREA
jgi:large conductance mechanosensitive channel